MPRPDGRIPYDHGELDELKARVDLVEVFRQGGVELRKVGLNWLAHCPFHKDNEASLSVNPQQNLWNCFGCKTGGDVLSFLQLKEGLSFPQAVERLRALAGAEASTGPKVTHKVPRDTEEKLPGGHMRAGLLDRVVEVYTEGLRSSREAQEYLASRKLGAPELWQAFRIGAATGSLMKTCRPWERRAPGAHSPGRDHGQRAGALRGLRRRAADPSRPGRGGTLRTQDGGGRLDPASLPARAPARGPELAGPEIDAGSCRRRERAGCPVPVDGGLRGGHVPLRRAGHPSGPPSS